MSQDYYQNQTGIIPNTSSFPAIYSEVPNQMYQPAFPYNNAYPMDYNQQDLAEVQADQVYYPQSSKYTQSTDKGFYDDHGFFRMPDGSFLDPDGFKFDANGFDATGGYYDENFVYVPGDGTNPAAGAAEAAPAAENFDETEDNDYYDEEEEEEKYTKEYIEFMTEQKYSENIEYINNSTHEYIYLMIGNMNVTETKKNLTAFLVENNIDTKKLTILMHHKRSSTIARLEIYDKQTAVDIMNLTGKVFNNLKIVVDVDEENEKLYYGGK